MKEYGLYESASVKVSPIVYVLLKCRAEVCTGTNTQNGHRGLPRAAPRRRRREGDAEGPGAGWRRRRRRRRATAGGDDAGVED